MEDQIKKKELQEEIPKIKKDTIVLVNDRYKIPPTSPLMAQIKDYPLIFHFENYPFISPDLRLRDSVIEHFFVEGKDVYLFDNFFLEEEGQELRNFSIQSEFSRRIFAEHTSRDQGEEPTRAMDNKEKWNFFNHPPQAIKEIYKFLSFIAHRLEADVTTLPWELYDQEVCIPSVATNRLESASFKNMELGKHEDYSPAEGIPFGIPVLYSSEPALHPRQFNNGEIGKPWLVSLMLYSTSENFLPEYGMGTVFCDQDGEIEVRGACKNTRFVLFEGDIIHSIEESKLPPNVKVWRISYVFKLVINPKNKNQSMKKNFYDLIKSYKQ